MSAEMANEIKLISGRSHPELSEKIAKRYVSHLARCTASKGSSRRRGTSCAHAAPLLTCSPSRLLQTRHRGCEDHLSQLLQPGDLLHRRRVGPRRGCFHCAIHRHGRRQRGADGAVDHDLGMSDCEVGHIQSSIVVCAFRSLIGALQREEDNSRHVRAPFPLKAAQAVQHRPSSAARLQLLTRTPDSPNFPYARQDKKDKVRSDTPSCWREGWPTHRSTVASSHQRPVGREHAADGRRQSYAYLTSRICPMY